MEEEIFGSDEKNLISRYLEKHHAIFERIWNLGHVTVTGNNSQVKTAAIAFNMQGEFVEFFINENFWRTLSFTEKCFVISHECLHISLNHGSRVKTNDKAIFRSVNIAQDLVINHALVDYYGFVKNEIDPDSSYFWIESIENSYYKKFGPNAEPIKRNQSYEYYFNIIKNLDDLSKSLVDYHVFSPEAEFGGEYSNDFSKVISDVDNDLLPEEKAGLKDFVEKNSDSPDDGKDSQKAGTGTGAWHFVKNEKVKKKKKWESVIVKCLRKYITTSDTTVSQWVFKERKYHEISSNLFIPYDYEMEDNAPYKKKADVWLFQDTSGSCISYKNRFFKAARSIPLDKFNVRLFTFDTSTKEIPLNSTRIYGGGGTSFKTIERKIQSIIKSEKCKYPDATFIITDGYGDKVKPQYPERWNWFLTTSATHYIPEESNIYKLKDFE